MLRKIFVWFKKPENLTLTFILILAAFLRLYKIAAYMTFLGDEGRDVLVVYNILHGKLTLLGPTASVGGFFLGPFYYYFMVPFLWIFNYNPVGPSVGIALVSIGSIWLIYKLGSEFFNRTTGLIAAGLYAIAPLVINYNRSSWNPNLLPAASLLVIYFGYLGMSKQMLRYFIITGIFLGIAMQLHYLALFLGAAIFIYILFAQNTLIQGVSLPRSILATARDYFGVGAGFIIGWSPFLVFEFRHNFANIRSIINFIFKSGDVSGQGNFFYTVQDVFFRSFARLVTAFPPAEQLSIKIYPNLPLWSAFTWLLSLTSTVFFLYVLFQKKHTTERKLQYSIIAVWFFTEIILFGFYKKNIYDYYFESFFPVPFLLVGFLISYLLRQKIVLKIVGAAVLLILLAINLNGIPFRYPANRQLAQMRKIAKFVYDKSGRKPYNLALVTGGNSDYAYRYFLTLWGKPPVTIQNSVVDPKRKTVTGQLWVICESLPCYPLGNPLWEIAGFGRAEIEGKWKVSVVEIYKLKRYQ